MALLSTDPVCFKRDANGDLKFPLELATGLEAIAILIRERLLLIRGEWFWNLEIGLPLLESEDKTTVPEADAILGQRFDPVRVREPVLAEILSVNGVIDVPLLRLDFDNGARRLGITWIAKTAFGDTELETLTVEI